MARARRYAPDVLARMLALLCVLLATGSCEEPPASAPSRLAVVATVYPLADIARTIGGSRVDVQWWIESGQFVATYQPSPSQIEALRRAAIVVSGGVGELYATEEFAGEPGGRRLIRLDSLIDPQERVPALWLDPTLARASADALAERLSAMDLAHAPDYRAAADRFRRDLDDLTREFDSALVGLIGKNVGCVGNDYSALARPFGFQTVQLHDSPVVVLDSAALSHVARKVVENACVLVLIEADTPPAVVKQVQASMPVPVVTIDSLGSCATPSRDTYLELMRFNYQQLQDGWRRATGF
ncbi:MAG: metal ABC transporter substrate-binding protein [Phycisphaerae bacterium]|nr:metal ABC transporter substrate-binding protein [Phycisphaerae bacterium]MDW8262799.1 metal ABC transporter substrate-binding protein [Phycisphaerales bacterium]